MKNATDEQLAKQAARGDRDAMSRLISRYEGWVFNLTHRMLWNRDAALDCTQDTLLRMVIRLQSFEGNSAFSTWLYRIAVNEVLMWKRKSRAELGINNFECYGRCIEEMPPTDLPEATPERAALIEEARIGCTMGMLLCLTRKQRVTYVLGEIFGLSDTVCAEVLELSPATFRKRLSRSRKQLHDFLEGHCSLVNPDNPCRCAHKTAEFIRLGIVDKEHLQFVSSQVERVRDVAMSGRRTFDQLLGQGIGRLYRDHPYFPAPDMVSKLKTLITHPQFLEMLDLEI